MKILLFILAFTLYGLMSCSAPDKSSPVSSPLVLDTAAGILALTVERPLPENGLSKITDMTHDRLEIHILSPVGSVDTAFTLSSSAITSKLIRHVPAGAHITVRADIYSKDDSLTHTGQTVTDIFAGETTMVTIQAQPRFGYLTMTIYNVPSNVNSGYLRITASDMAALVSPFVLDSVALDPSEEYDGRATTFQEYVLAGQNRTIEVFLLNAAGRIIYSGSMVMEIKAELNPVGRFVLEPASSKLRVSVTEPDFDTTVLVASLASTGKPETGRLIISEILYNSDGTDNNEWIELYNTTADSIDLSLYDLLLAETVVPLTGKIGPGGRCVVGESDSSYIDITTASLTLPNSGDSVFFIVREKGRSDSVSDNVHLCYLASEGWPTSSDGVAVELDPFYLDALSNNFGQFWHQATQPIVGLAADYGTPGF
ncbi:MAG: hypothetical protein A2293_15205 [Elusimicrobia bacterium RIFOXYB2_FULL_49_7]|nr:MAG: hypothetical protein A2293_15205 [Elusimicrobia bacterium RIFOXYB2_FULL_49_7]